MKFRKLLLFLLLGPLVFSISASSASTNEYQIIPPENKSNINFQKNSYNEIGTLKITSDNSFDTNKKVIVTIQHNGKFTDQKNPSQTVTYDLVIGTPESFNILNSGDKIEFSPASIDAKTELTLGVIVTSDAPDGDYKSEIGFSSAMLTVPKTPFTFGKYTWRVLSADNENNRAFLITENCVTTMLYSTHLSSDWSESGVRNWLNKTFLDDFENKDTNQILSVSIKNLEDQNKSSTEIIDATGEDKFFLLSLDDVKACFTSMDDRKAKYENKTIHWWLRSPGSAASINVKFVGSETGGVENEGYLANGDKNVFGVRPAMWLNLISPTDNNATTTINFSKTTPANSDTNTNNTNTNSNNNDNKNNNGSSTVPDTKVREEPKEILTDSIKNLSEEALIEEFENSPYIILSGDMSDFSSKQVADFIEKIENATSLKALDMSSVTGLTKISLPEDSKLEELIIKNSNTLTAIDVSNSFLKKLDVSGCAKIETLNCEGSNITELDLNDCSKLLYLNCSYNDLARLDTFGLENLTELKCDHQGIDNVQSTENFNLFDFLFRIDSEIFSSASLYLNELDRVKNLRAFNEDGESLEVNLDKNIGVAIFSDEPATIKYNYATGFNDVFMDVTVSTISSKNTNKDSQSTDGGGGGCNMGFNFFAAFLPLLILKFQRR